MQILSPFLLVLLFFLFYYEWFNFINGGTLSIDGSLSYWIGLALCVGNGSAIALNLVNNKTIPIIYKIGWVLVGGVIGWVSYATLIQFL